MGIRITTLSENTAGKDYLLAEWGQGIFVETEEMNILFDTGAGISLVQNAGKLGIDLQTIDKIVLSHGHFDHTGGLQSLLSRIQREVPIIAHPDIWGQKYSHHENRPDRYIGVPYARKELESLGARFVLSSQSVILAENILTTGEISLVTDFEEVDPDMFVKTPEGWSPDPLMDDQALILKTPLGLVVVLGCSHRGMINTLYRARELTGIKKIHMVLGGCHLKDASEEQIWHTISALNEIGVQKLGVSHCTGMRATLLLAQTFGDDFIFNNTGNIINL